MTYEEKKVIEHCLAKIGAILMPMIHELSNEHGVLHRARVEKHHYGALICGYLETLHAFDDRMVGAGKLSVVPIDNDNMVILENEHVCKDDEFPL